MAPEPHNENSAGRGGVDPLRDQLRAAEEELQRELLVVGEIQRSLLPERLPEIPGFDMASYYRPSATAGGDYFDVVALGEERWGLVMADVAGHGASAAVIMAVMRALVHAHLPHTRALPASVFLGFINQQMAGAYTREGRFVTMWAAMLHTEGRRLDYCSAGHNPARLVRGGRIMALDAVGGLPLGIDDSAAYQEVSVTLERGDLLVVYTDGVTEAMRREPGGKQLFELERLDRTLVEAGGASAAEVVARVTSALAEFSGDGAPADDQTMLAVRVE